MDRCKLDYIFKNFNAMQKKRMVQEIDPFGVYMFNEFICKFLKDPDTTDKDILCFIPGWRNPKHIETCKERYRDQYKKINDICIHNNIAPFFKNPNNIKESELTRLDLIKLVPEENLNKFYGVKDYWSYEPPTHNEEK